MVKHAQGGQHAQSVPDLPTIDDIEDAAERLRAVAVETPLVEHPALNAIAGGRILIKAENLQRTGSFKFRGAYNAVRQIADAIADATTTKGETSGGVVAASSGNHAQGIAAAAKLCDLPAAIVMPSDAPPTKIERTRALGAEVILYDRATEDRIAIACDLAETRGAEFVHPFDNFDVIAGQGTTGLEIVEQAKAQGLEPDQVLVCCAGGGLTGGVATAVDALLPGVAIHPVEPEGFDDFKRSLESGMPETNERTSGSVCDALLVPRPGVRNFAIGQELFSPGLVVTDQEALDAVAFAFRELRLVAEPGGAVALAAVLTNKVKTVGRVTSIVISGGNIDAALLAKVIQDPA
ncbi:MAG: threonine/serine dehydratase [Pseudomonadota bacterium]